MTAQEPDFIRFGGQIWCLVSNPLESLFDQDHPRPKFVAESTANWRGYVAYWEIEDDRLFLLELEGLVCCDDEQFCEPCSLKNLFPDGGGRIAATWFTGTLSLIAGSLVRYVHSGYESRYERYIMLDVDGGELIGTRIEGNTQPLPDRGSGWDKLTDEELIARLQSRLDEMQSAKQRRERGGRLSRLFEAFRGHRR